MCGVCKWSRWWGDFRAKKLPMLPDEKQKAILASPEDKRGITKMFASWKGKMRRQPVATHTSPSRSAKRPSGSSKNGPSSRAAVLLSQCRQRKFESPCFLMRHTHESGQIVSCLVLSRNDRT